MPLFSPRAAAEFHAALVSDSIRRVNRLTGPLARYLFFAGRDFPTSPALAQYTLVRQRGTDLGNRLERAFRRLFRRHAKALVLGTDSPTLPGRILRAALRGLRVCDAVLGPSPDGGYYLIGLRRLSRGMFRSIRWGSAFAFRDTLRNLLRRNFSCSILEPWYDVDRPEDVEHLRRELTRSRAARRLAPATWRFLKERTDMWEGSTSANRTRARPRK